jgi:hypothetical protein
LKSVNLNNFGWEKYLHNQVLNMGGDALIVSH